MTQEDAVNRSVALLAAPSSIGIRPYDNGGPGLDELTSLLLPLVRHPKALGMEVTIYDPGLDPDRSAGERLVGLLERLLSPSGGHT